jgi:ferrochelatase
VSQKTAVVLFNLGGPDSAEAVQPFLFNLFHDPAIMAVPQPLRWVLAKMISRRRAPVARDIYARIGGSSPILANTEAQARALEARLGQDWRCFVAMRYWRPRAGEVARAVREWGAERIVLLPLYPQFSTTTTASSLADWRKAAESAGLRVPTTSLCCYPRESGFVMALVQAVEEGLAALPGARVLFSAHGLPKKIVASGDPYQWQIEQTVAAAVERLAAGLDHVICYQSRVGPLEWLTPSTDAEIRRAGTDKVPVVVVPVSFVSEHSETLVELDIEYRHLAESSGVSAYHRAPTVGVADAFVDGLAEQIRRSAAGAGMRSGEGGRICPRSFRHCALAAR